MPPADRRSAIGDRRSPFGLGGSRSAFTLNCAAGPAYRTLGRYGIAVGVNVQRTKGASNDAYLPKMKSRTAATIEEGERRTSSGERQTPNAAPCAAFRRPSGSNR
jgi:hypothetical protein